jgi:imidazolonepropionase-like amidohydrolase
MNIHCRIAVVSALIAYAVAAPMLAQDRRADDPSSAGNNRDFIIRDARIFDGNKVLPKGDVWVEGGKIKAIGSRLETPANVRTIDGRGKTLLPGLIDAHVHTMGNANFLRSALALGVTTELDMGASPRFADEIEREQAEGKHLDMADLRSSRTQPTAPDGHGTEYGIPIPTIAHPEEAQPLIDALIAQGADFIGEIIYDDGSEYGLHLPTLDKPTLRAVVDAAHRRGKLAVVHVLSAQSAKDAIAAGADGLVHLFADHAPDDEFVSLATGHRAFVMPTLSLLASLSGRSVGPSLAQDPRFEPYLSSEAIADLNSALPQHAGNISYTEETIRRLHARGIRILAGTDGHNPGTAHGVSLLNELQLLVNAGLTPIEALASATSENAAAFHLDDRGQIATGKRADLTLVAGDPTTTISDVYNIVAVWKSGVEDDRERYRHALDEEKAAEERLRHAPAPAESAGGLVSDFEKGTPTSVFGRGWVASTGRMLGGAKPMAQLSVVDGGAQGSQKALQVSGSIAPGVFGWAGAMFFPGSAPMTPVNLSSKRAISFWVKGDNRPYHVMLFAKRKGSIPAAKSFIAPADWTRITMPLSAFATDGSDLQAVMIAEFAVPGSFAFQIDDIRFDSEQ